MNLQTLIDAIDQLPPDELTQLRQHIDQRLLRPPSPDETPEERIAALHAGFAELREGLSDQELKEMLDAINAKHIDPDDLKQYTWIDETVEDEA